MITDKKRRLALFSMAAAASFSIAFHAQSATPADNPKVRFVTTQGEFLVELYPDKAPKTVENFLRYVTEKHYDGTIFHRVIDNFMIQGGGFDADLRQKPTHAPVAHEGRMAYQKGLRNTVGTLAMARTNDPQSATAQFFINVKDNGFLDPVLIPEGDPVPRFEYRGQVYQNVPRAQLEAASQLYGYTVFGKVVQGMEVVNKIKALPTGAAGPFGSDVPKTTVQILSATLLP
ncbi:MAG: peptidylprolyl isomerase [Rhodoferax sp.]